MASDGNQQPTTGSSLPAPSTSNDGAQTAVITCDPQTLNQFFRVFETLYRQCRPGSAALPALEPTQDVIPDTPPPIQGLSGSSAAPSARAQQGPSVAVAQAPSPATGAQPDAAASGRPGARAQSARSRKTTQATGKGKAPAKGKGKGKAPKKGSGGKTISQAIGTPSVFQEQQVHSSTEDSAGSGSEGEAVENQPSCSATDASTSTTQGGKRKAKKKHTSAKKKRSKHSDTEEEESGTSSSDSDSEGPMDGYWGIGESNHGIPLWAHERRANSHRKVFNGVLYWKDGALVEDVKVATNQPTDFILGNHLSQRKRNKILNGDYVDIFTLLPPTKITGKGEKRRSYGRRRYRTPRAERTFDNWLDGYQVFMGVVCAAYPHRAMDLVAYQAHVRRARALAGENAALTYDENFRRNASLHPTTRWDLTDPNYWGEDVNPYIEKKSQEAAKVGKIEPKKRRQCWEFNRGVCSRPFCKYLHECEQCWGNHPASACFKNRQQPFRGGRGYFHTNPRGAPGASRQGPGNRQ
ncbi:uncharacterized protein LOC144327054 [Podarcis muralis]